AEQGGGAPGGGGVQPQRGADGDEQQGRGDVVGQRHPAHRGERRGQRGAGRGAQGEQEQGRVAGRHGQREGRADPDLGGVGQVGVGRGEQRGRAGGRGGRRRGGRHRAAVRQGRR